MNKKVTIGQILTVIVSIILGMITILIIQNFLLAEKIEFNTIGLIGFIISILFAGASIVLAITAIHLGKSSEQMMIERSEKSIELQTEIYVKTTEALKKIESSTGVTEKRIEDIIAGRAGDIANKLVDDKIVTKRDREKLERELKKSFTRGLTEEEREKRNEERQKEQIAMNEYKKFKDDVLLKIANNSQTKSIKIGDGSFLGSGEDILDGLFEINENKIGLCIFYDAPYYEDIFGTGIDKFLNSIAEELLNNTFQKIFLVFNEGYVITERFNKEIEKIKHLYKGDISSNIELVTGQADKIVEKIIN